MNQLNKFCLFYIKSWVSQSFLLVFYLGSGAVLCLLIRIFRSLNFKLLIEVDLFTVRYLPVQFILLVDKWRLMFFFTVIVISFRVFSFSNSYIRSDNYFIRFHCLLLIFVFSIVLLIFSPGIFRLFLGWDGLGLRSFLLVIYYRNFKSLNAGLLTFCTNRLGDGFLLCAAGIRLWVQNFNIYLLFKFDYFIPLLWLFILGAMTKRAQVPFRAWLPAAIAAPTPVSSLVHSSTLVTAGVYLLFRLFDILRTNILIRLLIVGLLTIFLASFRAIWETDIKKIVALSTLRQLGLIIIALGLAQPLLCFLHLLTHAFFKALIFVSVGTVIHSEGSYQNLKIIGSVYSHPIVLGILTGANLSLCGFPFFSGFFRKEIIIQRCGGRGYSPSLIVYVLLLIRIFLTQIYRIRFFVKRTIKSSYYSSAKMWLAEDTNLMAAILILLCPAILTGRVLSLSWFLTFDYFLDPVFIKWGVLRITFIRLGWRKNFFLSNTLYPIKWFIGNMWLLPWFSSKVPLNRFFFFRVKNLSFYLSFFEKFIIYQLNFFRYRLSLINVIKNYSVLKLRALGLFFVLIIFF